MKKMKPPTVAEISAICRIVASSASPTEIDMKCRLSGVRTPNQELVHELEYHGGCGDELVEVCRCRPYRRRFDLVWRRPLEWNSQDWYSVNSFECGFIEEGGAR